MGPLTLYDKSFLQSLSIDESVWFDQFFYSIVTPLFYVETLADLKKQLENGRTPEQEVSIIASKFPDVHGTPCVFHLTLAKNNLLGSFVPMRPQIPVANGKPAKVEERSVISWDKPPENEAFSRWSQGEFLELERDFASQWRRSLNKDDLNGLVKNIYHLRDLHKSCKSYSDAKIIAQGLLNNNNRSHDCLKLVCDLLGVDDPQTHSSILKRWQVMGYPPIAHYAPYAAFVAQIRLFFLVALDAELIRADRNSYIDIEYLCYLPFCNIFVSYDFLHKKCAPLFLRADQQFIDGSQLKNGLQQINSYYLDTIPDEIKERGLAALANRPPKNDNFFVTEVWNKHFPDWQNDKKPNSLIEPEKRNDAQAIKIANAHRSPHHKVDFNYQDPDAITIKRTTRKKKGSWYQLPYDLQGQDCLTVDISEVFSLTRDSD